jgi:hypothetical protein
MRTKQQIFTLAATLVVALAVGAPALADCGANPGVISTSGNNGTSQIFTTAFAADASFTYSSYYGALTSCGAYAGCTPVSGAVKGSFWAQGTGDPAVGAGNDNGTFDLVATGGIFYPSFPSYGYYAGAELFTGWQPGTDGCIGGSNCLCMLLTDTDGANTYFAVVGSQSSPTFTTSLEQGGTDGSGLYNAPIIMQPVSAPAINGSARVGTDVQLSVSVGPQQGVYMKDGCNCGPTGYKVLQQIVPRGNMPPSDRAVGWVDAPLAGGGVQGVNAIGSQIDVQSTCGTADQDVYLATQLFFDSGFSTSLVSGNSSRVECGTNLADPDSKPRQRPDAIKPTPRSDSGQRGRGR